MFLVLHHRALKTAILERAETALRGFDDVRGMLLNFNTAYLLLKRHPQYKTGDMADAVQSFKNWMDGAGGDLRAGVLSVDDNLRLAYAARRVANCLLAVPVARYQAAERQAENWMRKNAKKTNPRGPAVQTKDGLPAGSRPAQGRRLEPARDSPGSWPELSDGANPAHGG